MNENKTTPEWIPIKDEEREWGDWDVLRNTLPIEYSTLKKYRRLDLFTTTSFEGKMMYDLTFIKRLLIYNMRVSKWELMLEKVK